MRYQDRDTNKSIKFCYDYKDATTVWALIMTTLSGRRIIDTGIFTSLELAQKARKSVISGLKDPHLYKLEIEEVPLNISFF